MEYEIRPKEKFETGFRELWQYRELFYFFTWRDIRVKYKQTVFGFAWAILQPLLMMVVTSLVFRKFAGVQHIPYPLLVCSGLVIWNVFSSGITASGNSMVANANIIKKIYFPRMIIPVSAVLVAFFDFLMTIPLLAGLMIYYGVAPDFSSLWMLPAALILTIFSTIGPGCFLSALNVKFRDFRYVIPFLVQFLFFATPVIYPEGYFKERWIQEVFAINPMSAPISLFRGFITGQEIDPVLCLISCSSALVFLIAGVYFFRKTESYFADLA